MNDKIGELQSEILSLQQKNNNLLQNLNEFQEKCEGLDSKLKPSLNEFSNNNENRIKLLDQQV